VNRLARAAAFALLVTPLSACPERRETPVPPSRKPPQAALAAGAPGQGPDVLSVARPEGPEFFGLYLMGKKAGWQRSEITRELRRGHAVLVARSEAVLSANVGGRTVERRVKEERVYEARAAGPLVEVRAEWSGDGGDRKVGGTCAAATCQLDETTAEGTRRRTMDGVSETAEQADAVRLAAARKGTLRGRQLDLEKMRVKEVETAFLRRETMAGAGVETPVAVVAEIDAGDRIPREYRVADDGRLLEVKLGEALVVRAEAEATAKKLDQIDLFSMARVNLPGPVRRDVPLSVTYRVSGLPPAFQVADPRQRYAPAPDGEVLLTVTARAPAAADPRRDTPLARAGAGADAEDLASGPQADSDAPELRRLAREVAGDAKTAYAAVLRLNDHVFRRLEKVYGASHDRASDVLRAGRGDCTEHSVLLVALARALGIPARGVHGLVYARYQDGVDALYWHAWVEVRSAGEWIAVDPTFGQPVADATHVALGRGTQVDAVGLLGAIKVDAVEMNPPGHATAPARTAKEKTP
jgi:hypothetical protein